MNWWAVVQSILSGIALLLAGTLVGLEQKRRDKLKAEEEARRKEFQSLKDDVSKCCTQVQLQAYINEVQRLREELAKHPTRDELKSEIQQLDGALQELYSKAEVEVDGLSDKLEKLKEDNERAHRDQERGLQSLHLELKDTARDIPKNLHGIVMELQKHIENLRARVGTRSGDNS